MYYGGQWASDGTNVYMVSSFNQWGFFVSEFTGNGSYEIIVENYLPDGETCGLPRNVGIACAPDGTPYIFEALWTASKMQVYKVSKDQKTVSEYGPGIPISITSNGSTSNCAVFGINPESGQFICAVEEGESEKVLKFKYLDESLQWNDFDYSFTIGNDSAYIKEIALDCAADGITWVAVRIGNNKGGDGIEGIHLFSIGLEDDILPE